MQAQQLYQDDPVVVIEAEAAAILSSVTRAVGMILERRAELDRAGQKDMPLVVMAGEDHSMPAYYIHHMLLLDGLSREEEAVVGLENPHNQIEEGRTYDPEGLAQLKGQDGRGDISLTDACGFWFQHKADHSNFILSRFLLRRNIATRFVDAARPGPMLDYKDPSTLLSFKACRRQVSSAVPVNSPGGEHIRNHHMATMIADFAKETGARIIVVRCGANHVAGRLGEHEGRHSLATHFRQRAIPLIGMLPWPFWLPQNHGLRVSETFKMTDMPKTTASYDCVDGRGRAAEAAYINPLLDYVGFGHETLTPEEHKAFKTVCQKSLDAIGPVKVLSL